MGRKALGDDGMQKTLSVRISEKVTAFLEHTRSSLERAGEKASTSDVARQMLDAIVDQKLPAGFVLNKAEMLIEIVHAQCDGLPLTLHQYAFLADQAHAAYQRTSRDFVRPDLLLNNLSAFEAVVKLRNSGGIGESGTHHDAYFYANLGHQAQEADDLLAAIESARELIRNLGMPFRSTAEFMSRNLEVALRGGLNVPGDLLDQALRPYLRGLLLLAIKSWVYESDSPVESLENRHEALNRMKIRAALNHRNEGFRLSFIDGSGDVSVYLAPITEAWSLTCGYQRFVDLMQLVKMDRSGMSDYFTLSLSPETGLYVITARDSGVNIGLRLTECQISCLRELLSQVTSNEEYQRVFALLELRYGSV